jgi:cellulose synthase/poly-beta-1,6-N-acetylglucosamine synthase-like glycosyltransferase
MAGGATDLTVVVCTMGKAAVAEAVESIASSARAAGRTVQLVVVWQAEEEPPPLAEGVEVVRVPPAGLSHARNEGLAVAKAELVGFVDDDEVVDEQWVREAVSAFKMDGGLDGVFGPVLTDARDALPYFSSGSEKRVFEGRHRPPWAIGTGGNMVFRRETLVRAGGFDTRFGAGAPVGAAEETDLFLRLLGDRGRLLYTPQMPVYHPLRGARDELAARRIYAFGMGAALRRSPVLAGKYLYTIAEELGRSVRRRDAWRRRKTLATLRGFCGGLFSRRR